MFRKLLFSILILQFVSANSQNDTFRVSNPLRIEPSLSGSFGELRANHFHTGIDLKTAGKTGLDILAAADGFVSRIKVSPYGYGLALYIDHPEGYTTVYGHLEGYNAKIMAYVEQAQLDAKSYEVDIYPAESELPVKRGQVVAFSGNSGHSGGPHLHFEVRETKTEVPRNPLLFGFPLEDQIKPTINAISIEPIGDESMIRGKKQSLHCSSTYNSIRCAQPIEVSGPFGVGVNGYDQMSGSSNHNGFFQIEVWADSILVSRFTADSIAFDQSRYINAQIDYAHYYRNRSRYFRMHRLPGNFLEVVKYAMTDGQIELPEGNYKLRVVASDADGNSDEVSFDVLIKKGADHNKKDTENTMHWNRTNAYETEFAEVILPKGSLYENIEFKYSETIDKSQDRSALIGVHEAETPVHTPFTVRLKTYNIQDTSKAFIAQVSSSGRFRRALNSKWNGDWLEAESKYFGHFRVMEDQTPPSITYPWGVSYFKVNENPIEFRISDGMSGIFDYNVYIDGQWTIAAYEHKSDALIVQTKRVIETNAEHELLIYVSDLVGNVATFEGIIYK